MKLFKFNLFISDLIPPILIKIYDKISLIIKKKQDPGYNGFSKRDANFIHKIFGSYDGFDHEDLLIDLFFNFKATGFYVEIGANDPDAFPSHATRFYLKGWRGINIEPQIEPFKKLAISRREDVNLNLAIGPKKGKMPFYIIEGVENGSSFNRNMATKSFKWHKGVSLKQIDVEVITMSELFDNYLDPNREIDFVSIDVEGFELEVLKSNDWKKYRPKLFIIETVHYNYEMIKIYLQELGYVMIYNNDRDSMFADAGCLEKRS